MADEMNRKDGVCRKFVLVECGRHFEAVTRPRTLKAMYSKEWHDGKPVGRNGLSHGRPVPLELSHLLLEQLDLGLETTR